MRDPEARFWLAFLGLGSAVLIAESAMTEIYVATTPDGPHRGALAVIAATLAASGAINIAFVPWVSRRRWRHSFALVWTLTAGAAVTAAIGLDGGMSSPLLLLLLLPIMYGGLAFSPRAIAACAFAAVVELVVLVVTDAASDERPGTALVALSAAVGIGLIVWATSRHRWRLQKRTTELTRELELMAATDGLTGCLNRRAFVERMEQEVERALRYDEPLTVVIADVDRLKQVNDALGHGAGDAALRAAGERLRAGCRQSDAVARIGGDEFAVLLPTTSLDAATPLVTRLLAPYAVGESVVSFSAGVAALDRDRPTPETLLRDADLALYHAKRTGRAGVAVLPASGSPVRLDDAPECDHGGAPGTRSLQL
jgi:diguanylate cyclase (GGDEF)-like protein